MPTTDMQGKTVVITGASAGIGAVAARELAARGADVVPVGRSPEKTAALARELGVEPLVVDFARLDDVRRLAAELRERCPRIDVLANNAGGIFPRRVTTADGHELTFQVDHLAPFLLTLLLSDSLAAARGRVVFTSSSGHRAGRLDLDDLEWERRRYVPTRVYGTAKLANILTAREIARRWAGDGIAAAAFHPGNVATEFGRDWALQGIVYRTPLRRLFLITPEQGAKPLVDLATTLDASAVNGVYFDRATRNGNTSPHADDARLARELWERSAALVGVTP